MLIKGKMAITSLLIIIGFLRRNLRNCPTSCKRDAYISLVRSILEYGSIIWDPYLKSDIDRLERVQHQGARFITRDYRSTETGCVTKMLQDHALPLLRTRREHQRLAFMYRVVEGLVPALPVQEYLTPKRRGRPIKAKKYTDCVTENVVVNLATNNSKCFQVPTCNTVQCRNSFFYRTVINWNNLDDDVVCLDTAEAFKSSLSMLSRQSS